jgi:hypothetical protein
MSEQKPSRPTWEERCAQLAAWIRDHNGRAPDQRGDAEEHSLYVWLCNARRRHAHGNLAPARVELFESSSVGLKRVTSTGDWIVKLAAFYESNGRLPKGTAPAGSAERAMATALIANIRPKLKAGKVKAEHLEALSRIPGAAAVRFVPDQDGTLAELTGYAELNGCLPPKGGCGTADENRLATWWRNNVKGNPDAKTPRLRDRHLALLALELKYPAKSVAAFTTTIHQLEQFVAATGHLPAQGGSTAAEERRLGAWLIANRFAAGPGRTAEELERIRALCEFPSRSDAEWQANFEVLRNYAAAHAGRLPTGWHEGPVFSWLTAQRRAARIGKLSEARREKLLTINGVPREAFTAPIPLAA